MSSLVDIWSNGAKGYRRWQLAIRPLSLEVVRILKEGSPPQKARRILDVAGGTGEPSTTLVEEFPTAEVVATDIAPGMLVEAKEYAAQRNVTGIKFEVADAQDLATFEADSFDAVTCVAGLFLMPEPLKALKEFKRVLKPGGRVIVTTWAGPEETNFATTNFATLERILGVNPMKKQSSIDLTNRDSLMRLFTEAGFSNVKLSDFNLEFKYTYEQLETMNDHPMTLMGLGMLVKAGKVEQNNAWPFFFKELMKTAKDEGFLKPDNNLIFPTNRANIVLASA